MATLQMTLFDKEELNRILLNLKSDQHLVSPYNNTVESIIYDHENIGYDHQLQKLLIVKQILLFRT